MGQINHGSETSELNIFFAVAVTHVQKQVFRSTVVDSAEESREMKASPMSGGRQCTTYSHPSLFVGSYFPVSQIRRDDQRITIHHSDPAMDRNTRTVRQLEQVFEAYCMMFKGMKGGGGGRSSSHSKKRKTIKGTKRF